MAYSVHREKSGSGVDIPVVTWNGRDYPLHSRFDPEREAQKLYDISAHTGYIVVFGLGFAYHIIPFLRHDSISRIIIIEKNRTLIESILELHDFSGILNDIRVTLLMDLSCSDIGRYIETTYVPMIDGMFSSIMLRARYDLDKEYFSSVGCEIEKTLVRIRMDFSVQAYFGKRWFGNGLRNLAAIHDTSLSFRSFTRAIITAAGPSLENHCAELQNRDADTCIIATDTSFPYLKAMNIIPDFLVSIDCQHISYSHFLCGIPDRTVLVLDLFSTPSITRSKAGIVFCLNAHPLSRLAGISYEGLPAIDMTGGNVTHAALSFAVYLQIREIVIVGADYSYPAGKSYARDTYIYKTFRTRESRLKSVEDQFYRFLFRTDDVTVRRESGLPVYNTSILSSYRDALYMKIEREGLRVEIPEAAGDPIRILTMGENTPSGKNLKINITGNFKKFITDYLRGMQSLPLPEPPFWRYMKSLTPELTSIALTILPVAAYLKKHDIQASHEDNSVIFRKSMEWCIAYMELFL